MSKTSNNKIMERFEDRELLFKRCYLKVTAQMKRVVDSVGHDGKNKSNRKPFFDTKIQSENIV